MRKSLGKEAKLSYSAHALMENRNGLLVDLRVGEANGRACFENGVPLTDVASQIDLLPPACSECRRAQGRLEVALHNAMCRLSASWLPISQSMMGCWNARSGLASTALSATRSTSRCASTCVAGNF